MKRWLMASVGVALQLCIGTVYAWSYFQIPIAQTYGWSNTQVAWVFSTTIVFLSLGAALGGAKLAQYGPRRLAVLGSLLFGAGYLIGSLALHLHSLILLYLGYGVIGGTGIGLAYVTPVATVAKWFPDRKGLSTGMVIMGFGLGAMFMSKAVAPLLMQHFDYDMVLVFLVLGLVFLTLATPLAWMLHDPPAATSEAKPTVILASAVTVQPFGALLRSGPFVRIWLLMFCNTVAGIMFIGFQSPMVQELWHRQDAALSAEQLAGYGATLIAISALFNGVGRFAWASVSDRLGRVNVFRTMLLTQFLVFLILGNITDPWLFGVLVCYVLLCYGGGFGTLPSFVSDVFGPQRMASVYGAMLTTWGAAGIVGPQLVAWLRDHYAAQSSAYAFHVGAVFLLVGFAVSLGLRSNLSSAQGAQRGNFVH